MPPARLRLPQVMSQLYPIFLRLQHCPVLVVGGGAVGLRKAAGLSQAGAAVTVVASSCLPELVSLQGVTVDLQNYAPAIMTRSPRWRLVFAATNVPAVNAAVERDAAAAGILCCRCDDLEAGDFVGGATLQRSGVTLAISTTGASPVLAARLRDRAAATLDPLLVRWSELLALWRPRVLERISDPTARRLLLHRLAGPEMESSLRISEAQAHALFDQWLVAASSGSTPHAS